MYLVKFNLVVAFQEEILPDTLFHHLYLELPWPPSFLAFMPLHGSSFSLYLCLFY